MAFKHCCLLAIRMNAHDLLTPLASRRTLQSSTVPYGESISLTFASSYDFESIPRNSFRSSAEEKENDDEMTDGDTAYQAVVFQNKAKHVSQTQQRKSC